jgi:hypothetical protein
MVRIALMPAQAQCRCPPRVAAPIRHTNYKGAMPAIAGSCNMREGPMLMATFASSNGGKEITCLLLHVSEGHPGIVGHE